MLGLVSGRQPVPQLPQCRGRGIHRPIGVGQRALCIVAGGTGIGGLAAQALQVLGQPAQLCTLKLALRFAQPVA